MTNFLLIFLLFQSNNDPLIDTYINGAQLDAENKEFIYAQEKLDKALELDPNNHIVYYWKGYTYMTEGDLDLAIENFTQSILINNRFPEAYNTRGLCYGYQDEIELALSDFDRAILIDPQFTEAYINRGSSLIGKDELQMAELDLKEAINIDSENGSAYFHLGRVYQASGELLKAQKQFQSAINNNFVNYEVMHELGNVLFMRGDFKNAVDAYSVAIDFKPNHHETINNRALAYDSLGKKQLASKDRKTLQSLSGINFKPLDKITYKTFNNKENDFSIILPSHWNINTYPTEIPNEEYVEVTPFEKTDKKMVSGLIKIRINKKMDDEFNIEGAQNLLDFWLSLNKENTDKYETYDVAFRKNKKTNGYLTNIFQSKSVIEKNSEPVITKEIIIAKETELITIFLESPLAQYKYFEPIFDKAFESITVK